MREVKSMNDLDVAIALVFRSYVQKAGATQKAIASEMGTTPTGLSKILAFRQRLTFQQVYLFCEKYGFEISIMSNLIAKISQDKALLRSVQECYRNKKQVDASLRELLCQV